MPASLTQTVRQLHFYINFLHQYNHLPARAVSRVQAHGFERAFARTILDGAKPQLAGREFTIVKFRSLFGKDLHVVLAVDRHLKLRRKLTAFVGHRFIGGVTHNLRHNLQLVCKPYKISLLYSDTDMPNESIFDVILTRIRESDFCIFDDRETEVRPNVFVELGAAIALGRPHFYFNFNGKRKLTVGRKQETVTVPSDLAGMLHLAYSSYEDLFAQLAVRLPGFLLDRGLASR